MKVAVVPRRPVALAVALIALVAVGNACSMPKPDPTRCSIVDPSIVKAIASKITAPGKVRYPRVIQVDGLKFISLELHTKSEQQDQDGDILTFVQREAKSDQFEAVDTYAVAGSTWPKAPFDVHRNGVIESRGCVDYTRNYSNDLGGP